LLNEKSSPRGDTGCVEVRFDEKQTAPSPTSRGRAFDSRMVATSTAYTAVSSAVVDSYLRRDLHDVIARFIVERTA
jgi:hypothetical protein